MLTRVAAERLLAVPQMEPVRRAILEDALEFYRGFLEEHGTDPAIRYQTGQAYLRAGKIYSVLGKDDQAEEAVRGAIALFEKLVAEFPTEPVYRAALAAARRNSAGILQHRGRIEEAEAAYRGSVELCRALVAGSPEISTTVVPTPSPQGNTARCSPTSDATGRRRTSSARRGSARGSRVRTRSATARPRSRNSWLDGAAAGGRGALPAVHSDAESQAGRVPQRPRPPVLAGLHATPARADGAGHRLDAGRGGAHPRGDLTPRPLGEGFSPYDHESRNAGGRPTISCSYSTSPRGGSRKPRTPIDNRYRTPRSWPPRPRIGSGTGSSSTYSAGIMPS